MSILFLLLNISQVDGAWQTEIVRDSAVITAYVRKRQQIEEELIAEEALAPTGDMDRDARARKKYVQWLLIGVADNKHLKQIGGAHYKVEEESGASCKPQKRKSCKGRWCHIAVEANDQDRDNGKCILPPEVTLLMLFVSDAAGIVDKWDI